MKLFWLIAILVIVLCISLIYQTNTQEPLTNEEMEKAMAYDAKKEFEQDVVKSSPKNADFVVLLEELQNNNANKYT